MPKAIKKKVTKKDIATEEDVREKLTTLKDTIRQRQKTVLMYVAGILVVLVAISGFLLYSYNLQKKAKIFEYEAYKIFYNIDDKKYEDRQEQYREALDKFKKAYDTKKSPISLFYIAACYYELGSHDDALGTLKDFTRRYAKEERLLPLAYQKMAMVHIKKGNAEEAMKTLDALFNLEGDIYKDFALMEYGRLLEKAGKPDEAKKKYKELTTRFPASPFFDEANAKLSENKES
ncbi:MAG: tetratricopeptide repeat protein [Nitrospirae bacterium]|nr:tetratricopeptide repeat protein [Nitrospirota bacterium]